MKTLIIFLLVPTLAVLFISCGDSLGVDPKVQIIRILKDTSSKDPDPVITIYSVDSVLFDFKEVFHAKNGRDLAFDWPFDSTRKVVTIDTGYADPVLTLDLNFESNLPDEDFIEKDRIDRVLKFNLYFKGALTEPIYRLDNQVKSDRWFELYIKELPRREVYSLSGYIVPAQLVLMEINKARGFIKLLLNVDLIRTQFRSRKFYGYIMIYYKN